MLLRGLGLPGSHAEDTVWELRWSGVLRTLKADLLVSRQEAASLGSSPRRQLRRGRGLGSYASVCVEESNAKWSLKIWTQFHNHSKTCGPVFQTSLTIHQK